MSRPFCSRRQVQVAPKFFHVICVSTFRRSTFLDSFCCFFSTSQIDFVLVCLSNSFCYQKWQPSIAVFGLWKIPSNSHLDVLRCFIHDLA